MNLKNSFATFKKNKGWYQFVSRSLIFFLIVTVIQFTIFLWFRHTSFFLTNLQIGEEFYISWLTGLRKTDFLNAAAFAIVAFIVWNREKLKKLPHTKRVQNDTILFGILAGVSLLAHYALKFFIARVSDPSAFLVIVFGFLKYLLLAGFFVALAYACYTKAFLHAFIKKYKVTIGIFAAVGVVYFFLIQAFQLIWYHLSYFVASSIRFLLSLTFETVYFSPGSLTAGPHLGVQGFVVAISDACSGIDSLLLFLSLYTLIFILDHKRMHTKRMLILFIPGIIGTIVYNILRIYSLMLVGIFYDPKFAVDAFHTNAGWILFLLFFMLFWHFGSKWVYKKK